MAEERQASRVAAVRAKYGEAFLQVLAALNSADLIPPWWNESWADAEYLDAEAADVLERLGECRDASEVSGLIRAVFARSVFADVATDDEAEYAKAAQRIWAIEGIGR